ncbi:MAG TPA: caspase family protein, partial [Longimicrobiaceae bacterium]|nr:caspase family protein [Longimicrobiaceae bacterium]
AAPTPLAGERQMARGISIHIGVNHPAGMHELLARSEATAWKLAELSYQAGYRSIHVLRGAEATREAVGALLASAAPTLRPGHTLFVSFSGHGSRQIDPHGDERDGWDEAWCLHDADLLDDELAEYWRLLAPGTRALVVADCCFAAGSLRRPHLPMIWCGAQPYAGWDGLVYRGVKQAPVALGVFTPPAHDDGIRASVLLLAATGEQQKAREGLYMQHLLEVWAGGAFRGSFRELHDRVSERVRREAHDQDPQLLMLGAPDPGFPLETAFHLDLPVMRGRGGSY